VKIAIFIDGAYLDKIAEPEFGVRIDYEKISKELSLGKELLRTYYYHCEPYQSNPPTPEESERFSRAQRFFSMLTKLPRFEVRLGKLQCISGEFRQKGVDTLLSIDMVNLAASGKISDAVLLAGDSDYIPAIKVIKDHGVNITLFHSKNRGSYHSALWDICDERFPIDLGLIEKIKRKPVSSA